MPTQIQYAQQIASMTESFMQGKTADGGNHHLIRRLKAMFGWVVLDSGHFSLVMEHPVADDLVVKVVLGAQDWDRPHGIRRPAHLVDGYMDFVATVMRGPRSRFLPEFHAAIVREKCAVVIMRRYMPIEAAPDHIALEPLYFMKDGFGKLCDAGLSNVVQCMGRANDLHPDNYMYDESNQCLVITDPYSRNKGTTHTHVERWVGKDGVVNVDVQFNTEPASVSKAGMAHADLAALEARMMAHLMPSAIRGRLLGGVVDDKRAFVDRTVAMQQIKRRRINGHRPDFMMMDTVRKELADVRPAVATDREKPTLRQQEKDHVLQLRTKYDCGAQLKGFPIVLLSGRKPRGLRTPWDAVDRRPVTQAARPREPADQPVDWPAE